MRPVDADYIRGTLEAEFGREDDDLDDRQWAYGYAAGVDFSIRKLAEVPTLTLPNEWVSVEERLPEPGERVLATGCGFVGEFYINKRGQWQRYNVNCSELLMALDILYWMPLPEPPGKEG